MFVYEINDKFSFGMYAKDEKTLNDIAMINPSYIEYCIKSVPTFCISNNALKRIIHKVPQFKLSKVAFLINQKKLNIHKRDKYGALHITKSKGEKPIPSKDCAEENNMTDIL